MPQKTKPSELKGVVRDKRGYWIARVKHGGQNIYLGSFKKVEEAALAHDTAVKQLYGIEDLDLFNFKELAESLPDNFTYKRSGKVLSVGQEIKRNNKGNLYGVKKTPTGNYFSVFVYMGEHHYLGVYETAIDAARARDKKIIDIGAKNKLNFPEFDYSNYIPTPVGENSTSKYRGVSYDKNLKKWLARITVNKKTIYIGGYDDQECAAQAYDEAALKILRENARLNFKK